MDTTATGTALGVHSEVGKFREVIVHRPGLALQRLMPENCRGLLFDDVLWVKKARQEHDVFADALRERGRTVHEFATLLADTLRIAEARRWLLDRRLHATLVGPDAVAELDGWLSELPAERLAPGGHFAEAAGDPGIEGDRASGRARRQRDLHRGRGHSRGSQGRPLARRHLGGD